MITKVDGDWLIRRRVNASAFAPCATADKMADGWVAGEKAGKTSLEICGGKYEAGKVRNEVRRDGASNCTRGGRAPQKAKNPAKSSRNEVGLVACRRLTSHSVAYRRFVMGDFFIAWWGAWRRMRDRSSKWQKLGSVGSLNFAYLRVFRIISLGGGGALNLKCSAEDSKAGFGGQKRCRWIAFARLSPAKSAFARLLVERFFCGEERQDDLKSEISGFKRGVARFRRREDAMADKWDTAPYQKQVSNRVAAQSFTLRSNQIG